MSGEIATTTAEAPPVKTTSSLEASVTASSTTAVVPTSTAEKNQEQGEAVPTTTTSSSSATNATTTANKNKPRSARLRHQIVAPGFGTQRDLERLAKDLEQPVKVIQAIMASKGRGYRRRSSAAETENKPAVTNNAWAAFLTEASEETVPEPKKIEEDNNANNKRSRRSTGKKEDEKDTTTTTESNTTTTTKTTSIKRDYDLSLLKHSSYDGPKTKKSKSSDNSGVLVQAGTLDASAVGRKGVSPSELKAYDLFIPTVLLPKIRFRKVISSCNAVHALAITFDSQEVYGWGRNEMSQLGGIDACSVVSRPTKLTIGDGDSKILDGAVGKHHSIVLVEDEGMYAAGCNKVGQCGINRQTQDIVPSFRKCVIQSSTPKKKGEDNDDDYVRISQIACGEQFSVALDEDGCLYTAGSSEFGQTGSGETGEYFVSANKLAFANAYQFQRRNVFVSARNEKLHTSINSNAKENKVEPLVDSELIRLSSIACGKHHAIAIEAPSTNSDQLRRVFTWGCGNYGCLGHGIQADEYYPRVVGVFSEDPHKASLWKSNPPVSCAAGASTSLVATQSGHVYYFGSHIRNRDAVMRPNLLAELAHNGHVVSHASAGNQTIVCSTENAVTIAWGQGPHGELGMTSKKKSSARPDFVGKLDKCRIASLACGYGNTYYVVTKEDDDDEEAISTLPVLDEDDEVFDDLDKISKKVKKDEKQGKNKK